MAALRNPPRALWRSLALAVLGLLAVSPGFAQQPTPVIVDTDAAPDDLVALLYLLGSPEVRVLGITTVNGVASPVAGARNIERLLAATGHSQLPVVVGAGRPLVNGHSFPEEWRQAAERLEGVNLPWVESHTLSTNAPNWLGQTLAASRGKVSILALGPLTNLARALDLSPGLCRKVDRIVWLGGAAFVPGNVDPWSGPTSQRKPEARREWNAYLDPEAARRLFVSGCPLLMVGLDAVYDLPLREATVVSVEKSAAPATSAAAQLLRLLLASPWQDGRSYVADAVAALALSEPALVEKRWFEVKIITTGKNAGETSIMRGSRRPNALVAVHIAAAPAEKLLVERLTLGAASRKLRSR